jgi:translocation and assembly module TamB
MSGLRRNGALESRISGRVFASRVEYTRDINLADFLSSRREGTISSGESDGSALGTIQLDVSIEGRDALVVRNNIADLTGSISMRVSGDANEPIISGRVTATGGNVVLLNNQRYDIQRAVVDFPPNNAAPVVNLQAESEIGGYQVFLGAIGPISEPESLTLNLRSNPALPYADVVSLITTGSLTDSEGGIPTLAQTGLNTAASVVTDALINEPIRRATDRLFGLNRFEIDPAISGRRGLNPSARLTVGRQINRNLSITYSTNLGADQNQVLAFEYRVSNKVSFVAQYEQAPLSNVTRRQDSFSFEVRFRRRF